MTGHHERRRPHRATAAAVATLFLVGGAAGCYSYVPPEPPGPVAGQEVRVELTGAGRDRLRDARSLDMGSLEGLWVEGDAEELAVQVKLDANRLGFGTRDFVDTIRVARADVRGLGVKDISTSRSILAGAAGVAAVAGLYAAFGSGEGGEGGDDDGGTQIILVPLSRVLGALVGVLGR